MRLLLFFDLPSKTKTDLKNYRWFVKGLKMLGFYRIQESVFVKMAIDSQSVESTIMKINSSKPDNGNVMVLTITEKQFGNINIIIGESKTDVLNSNDRVIEL